MKLFETLGFTTPKEKVVKTIAPVVQMPFPQNNTPIQVNSGYTKIIEETFAKVDLPGPDFHEFYKALKSLETAPFTEQQKYTAAFAGLSQMGLTKEKIESTSETYLKALDDEFTSFNKTMESFKKTEISDKASKINDLTEENTKLQAKIQSNLTEIGKLNGEVAQNNQKAIQKSSDFTQTIQQEKNIILTIITNVKNYL